MARLPCTQRLTNEESLDLFINYLKVKVSVSYLPLKPHSKFEFSDELIDYEHHMRVRSRAPTSPCYLYDKELSSSLQHHCHHLRRAPIGNERA
jgi:hypothetical protein